MKKSKRRQMSPVQGSDIVSLIGGAAFARISQYDYDRFNALLSQSRVRLGEGPQEIEVADSRWKVVVDTLPGPDCVDYVVSFCCESGSLASAGVSVDLDFCGWSADNYVLLPGAAYNGNRFLSRAIPYSPKLHYAQDIGPDKPIIITDVPRLEIGEGPSRIQERSGSLSTPSIGFRSTRDRMGFWLLTTQGNELGDYGLSIEETRDRQCATVSITSPVLRERYSYRICNAHAPSLDQQHDFRQGDEVRISFRVYVFKAPQLQSLFDKFAGIRKALSGSRAPAQTLPFSACLALQEHKFNHENWVPRSGYYSVGPRTNFLQDWQIGWTGGMISTYPLLFAGKEKTRVNVVRNFDWLFANGISPSGFFWDSGQHGKEWFGGDIRSPHTADWHLVRKSGDAVYYIAKQFELMPRLGIPVKSEWKKGLRRVCDAFVRLWEHAGQFGQFVDSRTGKVVVGGSSSGAIVPAGLAVASRWFGKERYLETACAAADAFYRDFVKQGVSCGGPGDACQNPDSESWYALVESFTELYEVTGNPQWLERATQAARQFATWVVSYDFKFPAPSTFAQAGIRSTGAVFANTQNKHAAPGMCTYSGLALLKLYRATGDRFYLDLLFDVAHNMPQYLPHPCHPLGSAVPGHMCERVNLTDWEGPERIGETLKMSTWAETSLMLTAIEIPGVYVRPDRALAVAFDNVTAEILPSSRSLEVRLANPTPVAAEVRVFAETEAEAEKPLPDNYLFACCKITLEPGGMRSLVYAK